MKKLILAATLLACSQAFAIFEYGPKVAVGTSTIIGGEESLKREMKPSYSVGAVGRVGLLMLDLQIEALYTAKGANTKAISLGALGEVPANEMNLTYLEIPLSVRLAIIPMLGVYAGGSVNTLLTAENKDGKGKVSDLEKSEFAVNVGLDLTVLSMISLDARYSQGVTPINKTGKGEFNTNFSLGATYFF